MSRCIAYINKNILINNLQIINQHTQNAPIIFMVKANAYGHGLKEVAQAVSLVKGLSFGVADIKEAKLLRHCGSDKKIYLFDGGAYDNVDELLALNIIPIIYNESMLKNYCNAIKNHEYQPELHIKIDTGFTRLGFYYTNLLNKEYDPLFRKYIYDNNLKLTALATHFSSADDDESQVTQTQIDIFSSCVKHIESLGVKPAYIHMANSDAIIKNKFSLSHNYPFITRPGLLAYGLSPAEERFIDIKPIMSIKARVLDIKHIYTGQSVGYGQSFTAQKPTTVATIAIGYGDGLKRCLSNKGYFLYKGQRASIVGTISMDSCVIDISHINGTKIKETATVMGAKEMASICHTIPYEIVTGLSSRIDRCLV